MSYVSKVFASETWKKHLNHDELVEYITQYQPDSLETDQEEIENKIGRDTTAVLKEVPIDSIKPGYEDAHTADPKIQKKYAKLPLTTQPPIIVQDGEIVDGHHRWRVAKEKGATSILIYECKD